jgi:WXG100 family type VII secretion target
MPPGAGLIVNPGAIKTYGQAVGLQAGTLERINSALAAVHLPADAFGKLPEAGDLYAAYTQHASEVLDITAKLPEQIQQVAQGLYSTAKSYDELEQGMAEGITNAFAPVESGGDGGGDAYEGGGAGSVAGQGTSIFATIAADTKTAYDWVNQSEEAIPAFAVDNIYGASSGLEGLLDEAIDWVISHVPELPKLLDDVTGDTEALKSAAGTWHNMGVTLNDMTRGLKSAAADLPESWAGEASASFGTFMGDVIQALNILAQQMGQTQQILEEAAAEAEFAHETIVMIIREVVEWVAGNLLADALTLGLATLAEAPATAAFLARELEQAEQAASKLAAVLRALKKIVDELKDLQKEYETAKGLERLKKFTTLAKDFEEKTFEVAKLKNLRAFGNGKVASFAKKVWESGAHGRNAEELAKVADMGKTEFLTRTAVKAGMSGTMGLTGVSAEPGLKGLATRYVEGGLDDLGENGQGAADAVGLGPPVPQAPAVNRIDALINHHTPAQEP